MCVSFPVLGVGIISVLCLGFIGDGKIFRLLRSCFCGGRDTPEYMKLTKQQVTMHPPPLAPL